MTDLTTSIRESIKVPVWDDQLSLTFDVRGEGPPLLYLHPAGGLHWDDFLADLTKRYTVYAPHFPGMALSDSFAVHALDDIFDVVLAYEQGIRGAGLSGVPVIGQSFGGMIAAEVASVFPQLFSAVILLDPAGLWDEVAPWSLDFMMAPPESLPGLLFRDPTAPGPQAMLSAPESPEDALEQAVGGVWSFGVVAKFSWPIPDRGLARRLHRVQAPTLIVWGEDDALIPVHYAEEFGRRITGSTVEIVPECGHIPQVEQQEHTSRVVGRFLDSNV